MEILPDEIIPQAASDLENGKPFVMATVVVGVSGTPARSGFKLIVYQDGSFSGTVGGGKLERLVLDKCRELHSKGGTDFQQYELTETDGGIGVQCGGTAKIFYEYFPPRRRIFIFGAGHLCRSFLPIISSLGFYCIVIDNRENFACPDKLPDADKVISKDYFEYLDNFSPTDQDAIVIFTHGHEYDFDILDIICRHNIRVTYIGMIGSVEKAGKAIDAIRLKNYPGELIESVFSPIGLNIGKQTTQEIAIAIAAEILAVYNNVSEIKSWKELKTK